MPIGTGAAPPEPGGDAVDPRPPLSVVAATPPAAATPKSDRMTATLLPEPPARLPGTLILNCVIFVRAVRPRYDALT